MSKFHKTKGFKELQDEWSKKLESSGFKDIEDKNEVIKRGSWDFRSRERREERIRKEEYFTQAIYFLNDYVFDNDIDRVIWRLHSEGDTVRNTSEYLRENHPPGLNFGNVQKVILRLRREMREFYDNNTEVCDD